MSVSQWQIYFVSVSVCICANLNVLFDQEKESEFRREHAVSICLFWLLCWFTDALYLHSKAFSLRPAFQPNSASHIFILYVDSFFCLCQAFCCVKPSSFNVFDLYIYRLSNDSELLKSILLTFYWFKITQLNCQK